MKKATYVVMCFFLLLLSVESVHAIPGNVGDYVFVATYPVPYSPTKPFSVHAGTFGGYLQVNNNPPVLGTDYIVEFKGSTITATTPFQSPGGYVTISLKAVGRYLVSYTINGTVTAGSAAPSLAFSEAPVISDFVPYGQVFLPHNPAFPVQTGSTTVIINTNTILTFLDIVESSPTAQVQLSTIVPGYNITSSPVTIYVEYLGPNN